MLLDHDKEIHPIDHHFGESEDVGSLQSVHYFVVISEKFAGDSSLVERVGALITQVEEVFIDVDVSGLISVKKSVDFEVAEGSILGPFVTVDCTITWYEESIPFREI